MLSVSRDENTLYLQWNHLASEDGWCLGCRRLLVISALGPFMSLKLLFEPLRLPSFLYGNVSARRQRPSSSGRKKWVGVVGAGCMAVGLVGCDNAPEPEIAKPIPVVKFQTIGEISSGRRLRLSGTLEAADTSVLSFQVGGRVAAIHVQVGDVIAAGQLLAELDKTDYEIELKSARAQLSSSRGALKEARENLNRQKQLYAKELVSVSALESAQASFEAAAGNVGVSQSAAKKAEEDLSRTVMTAPFSGTIAARKIDPFIDVSAGQAAFDLQSEIGMEAKVLVPEGMIREVDFGQAVKVTLPTRKGLELGGTVTEIASKANTGNAFDVNVTIGDVSGLDLRPGMTATVLFNFKSYLEGKTVYLIPMSAVSAKEAALGTDGGMPVDRRAPIFVFDAASGTVVKKMIVLGDIRGNSIEVYSGLEPGDQIVTAAVSQLYDGKKVRLWAGEY